MRKTFYWIIGAAFIIALFGTGFYIANKNTTDDLTILHARECVCCDSNGNVFTRTITGKYKTTKEMEKYLKEYPFPELCQQLCKDEFAGYSL